jgi:hypothetical protein
MDRRKVMPETISSGFTSAQEPATQSTKLVVITVLAAWFAIVMLLGMSGSFATPPGSPPFPILIGVTAPLIVFFTAFRLSPAFRAFVVSFDLRLMMGIQAWRVAGFGFLELYANGILPASFALPAGLGDIAIGATAPWLMLILINQPDFKASKTFIAWNMLGLLDLAVAVSMGAVGSALAAGTAFGVTTAPMARLPLVLIPAYFVPIFIMLHVAALLQARRNSR